jgi:hypothetical protein
MERDCFRCEFIGRLNKTALSLFETAERKMKVVSGHRRFSPIVAASGFLGSTGEARTHSARSQVASSGPALVAFVLLAGVFIAGCGTTPEEKSLAIAKNRAYAEVLIKVHPHRLLPGSLEFELPAQDFEVYRQTQVRMVKSPFVLSAVLRDPAIANLKLLKGQPQPFEFLEERLEVDLPATQFMRISFDGARSPDAAKIVNAVATEYLNEFANSENNVMNRRISELEKAHHDLNEQLRSKKHALRKLSALQTDTPGVLSEHQMMIELHAALRKQRVQMHLELASARAAIAAEKERVVRTANPASPEIGDDTRAKTQTLPSQLADRVRLAELTIQQLGEEMQKCKVAIKPSHDPSLEVETLQQQIEQIQKIDQRITETIELLKIETKAESRVVLYRPAEPGVGPEPDPVIMKTVGGVTLSALAIWFIVRLINRRSLRRLSLKTP